MSSGGLTSKTREKVERREERKGREEKRRKGKRKHRREIANSLSAMQRFEIGKVKGSDQ